MKKAILATKVGMTQIFNEDGTLTPVTVLQAGPCAVTQIKTRSTEQERKYKLSIFKSDLILFNSICTPLCRKSYITIIFDIHVTFKYNLHFNRTVFIF